MEHKYYDKNTRLRDIFSFDIEWNLKTVCIFLFLLAIPNLLGMINVSTPFGFNIHFFQIAIFAAAVIFGPVGGLVAGITGSALSAVMMHNPYLIIGNAILGLFVGIFVKYGMNILLSVVLAFAIQIPWLAFSDYYLMHMPFAIISGLIVALAISNIIWGALANYLAKHIKSLAA